MPALQINRISKSYRDDRVLNNIELEIQQGESFGLIGLNGAGKTTLLKSILHLHEVSTGDIFLFTIPQTQKQSRARLAYLPEKFSPPDFMTGWEYLHYIHAVHQCGYDKNTFIETSKMYCQKLDLEISLLKKSVKSFSKGMNQKLGIIGVLMSDKDFLIMDEPMSGLDPRARFLFKDIILELRQAGKTLLFCTHLLNDVEQLCDRMGILHKGSLRFIGTPEVCCRQYQAKNLEQAFLNCVGGDKPDP